MHDSIAERVRRLLTANAVEDALALLENARKVNGGSVDVWRAEAYVCFRVGDRERARSSMARAVQVRPDDESLREEYVELLAAAGFRSEAITHLRWLVDRTADWRRWFALGRLLYEDQREDAAADAFERAAALGAPEEVVRRALAESLFASERFDGAVAHFDALARGSPGDVELALRTVQARARGGDLDGAATALAAAASNHPHDPRVALALGRLAEDRGDAERAREAYGQAASAAPGWSEPVAALLMLDHRAPAAEVVARAEAMLVPPCAPQEEAYLRYALGKVADSAGRYDEAWSHWASANAIRRAESPDEGPGALAARVSLLRRRYTPQFVATAGQPRDPRPVLVLGMPRSGTTLVEQVLSSHPAVHGAGELPTLAQLHGSMDSELAEDVPMHMGGLAQRYKDRLSRGAPSSAMRWVDKQPYNFFFLGLAAALVPGVRVLWCRRDPRDIAVSTFSENFSYRSRYATDAAEIRELHDVHVDLMEHWRSALGVPVFEVDYARMVTDFEPTVREMLQFLDLPWFASCLEFHTSERAVQTNSRWQVRQPVHARSLGRWRNYARQLAEAGFDVT